MTFTHNHERDKNSHCLQKPRCPYVCLWEEVFAPLQLSRGCGKVRVGRLFLFHRGASALGEPWFDGESALVMVLNFISHSPVFLLANISRNFWLHWGGADVAAGPTEAVLVLRFHIASPHLMKQTNVQVHTGSTESEFHQSPFVITQATVRTTLIVGRFK